MGFSMSAKKTSEKTDTNKQDRRSNVDRRKFSYTEYIPERRSKDDRRKLENEEGTLKKKTTRSDRNSDIFYLPKSKRESI